MKSSFIVISNLICKREMAIVMPIVVKIIVKIAIVIVLVVELEYLHNLYFKTIVLDLFKHFQN